MKRIIYYKHSNMQIIPNSGTCNFFHSYFFMNHFPIWNTLVATANTFNNVLFAPAMKKFLQKNIFLFLLILLPTLQLMAQDSINVTGIVMNEFNQPESNVFISVEGSNRLPVMSNDEGEFTLVTETGYVWIMLEPAGTYKPKRVFLNNRKKLVVHLTSDDINSGDDAITILSQPFIRRNILSSFSDIHVEKTHHSPSLTIDQFLQGRVPGLYAVNRSGSPGDGTVLTLRGSSSIYAGNQPLFVIDGIPLTSQNIFRSNLEGYAFNPLVGLNIFDISKATLVKDPGITATYGSKGSNGLILIETLDPSVTQTTIELDLRTGYSLAPPQLIPQLNASQHKSLMHEIIYSSGRLEEDLIELYPSLFLTEEDDRYIDYQHNTNWQKLIFSDAVSNNINLNVKGGDGIARYGLSFGYANNKGIVRQTGYQGYNLRFVGRLNIFTWLRMDAGVSLNYNNGRLKESATVKETSPILTALAKSPLLNPYQYDIEGRELSILSEVDDIGVSNPLATIENYEARNSNYSFLSTYGFESNLGKNLTLNSKFSLVYNVLKEQIFMPNHGMEAYYNTEAINVSKSSNNDLKSLFNNTYLSYNKTFNNKHSISSITGMNLLNNRYEFDWGLTKNAHENDQYRDLQDGQNNLREIGGENRVWNWISFYEKINYNYLDKYLLTASLSLDGSSRIGNQAINTLRISGYPFGLFYSAGIGWRISNEEFLRNTSWLEELKLRLSYGSAGNDDIGESSATKFYQSIKFRETVGLFPASMANEKLSYERINQINAGVDISLLGNRITASLDLFNSITKDMIIFSPVKTYFGYDYLIENGGKMSNNGWEISTFFRLLNYHSFKWDIQTNISYVKNEVKEIKGEKLVKAIPGAEIVNMEGAPSNSFYGYIFKGVYSTEDEAINAHLFNDKGIPYHAGDAIFEDRSGPEGSPDGIINQYDKTTIGSSLPDYTGGFINTFSFKGWTLSGFIQFVKGNELFNYVRYNNERMTDLSNQSAHVLDRWQFEGQITDVPRALWNDPVGNSAFSTRWIEDGSYLRIKDITLSYLIPKKFLAFRNAEFYITAHNIFVAHTYLGYDPEFAYSYNPFYRGVDYGQTPQPRQFITGIRIGL